MRYVNAAMAITLVSYTDWPRMLPMILFAYRVMPQATTGYSPFFMMYDRDPLLPLQASTLSPPKVPFQEGGEPSYVADLIDTMASVFDIVRRRQDLASRINANRRDADQNRYRVTFESGDPVLIHEPDAASTKTSFARQAPPPPDIVVPSKWRMRWSGPHQILAQLGPNSYSVFHVHQRKKVRINVNALRLYHPFKDIPYEGIPQSHRDPPPQEDTAMTLHPPLRELKGNDQIDSILPGDLFMVKVPFNGFEPIALMRLIKIEPNNLVTAQWQGNYSLVWYIDSRFREQRWFPGWYQQNQGQFYFTKRPLHPMHPPFTNLHSVDVIDTRNIFVFGFELRFDLRLPREVADIALREYLAMTIPNVTEKGPKTYINPERPTIAAPSTSTTTAISLPTSATTLQQR